MKSCAYCGRENAEDATSCCGCGADEFVVPIPQAGKATAAGERNAESGAERESEYLKTDLPADHYLLASTDEELVEILARPSDWCGFDVAHARRLVLQRGIDLKLVEDKKAEHVHQLRRGKRASKKLIVFGWVFSVLGGLIGLGIAWSLVSMREKTPDGEFFTYDEESRAIGEEMLTVAGVILVVVVSVRLVSLASR